MVLSIVGSESAELFAAVHLDGWSLADFNALDSTRRVISIRDVFERHDDLVSRVAIRK